MNEATRQLYAAANMGHGQEYIQQSLCMFTISGLSTIAIVILGTFIIFVLYHIFKSILEFLFSDKDDEDEDY